MTAFSITDFWTDVLVDAVITSQRSSWMKRGHQLLASAPRPGDFHGRLTPDEIAAQDERIRSKAAACFARASLCRDMSNEPEFIACLDELWARHRALLAAGERNMWSAA